MSDYVVCLESGVDKAQFHTDMTTATSIANIPDRAVTCMNERVLQPCLAHYDIDATEAANLILDPRVRAVELNPEADDELFLTSDAQAIGNFDKPTNNSGDNLNWGLKRLQANNNNYGSSTTSPDNTFPYVLDGTGVDLVIMDGGMQPGHPEWQDSQGVSRLQTIDWYAEAGISGSMPVDFYTDYDGHGSHVAGIAGGKTYGWARNARLFSMHINLSGDTTGVSISDGFDLILGWHNNKPVDPQTGLKRPTVVNGSWGVRINYGSAVSGTHRGNSWVNGDPGYTTVSEIWSNAGLRDGYDPVVRNSGFDSAVGALIDSGIIYVGSAGNSGMKADVLGGPDYDNMVTYLTPGGIQFGPRPYMQGNSPYDSRIIAVGNIDVTPSGGLLDRPYTGSTRGPAVDIWAPGTNIRSATNSTRAGAEPYYDNADFKQTTLVGTSMSAPQIAGLACLLLEKEPAWSPEQVKDRLIKLSTANIEDSGLDDDYDNPTGSLMGGPNHMAYNPYATATPWSFGS